MGYKEEKKHKKEAIDHTQQRALSCFEALSAVIIAGPILVLSAPPRPRLDQSRLRGQGPDEPGQEVTHFRGGEGHKGR